MVLNVLEKGFGDRVKEILREKGDFRVILAGGDGTYSKILDSILKVVNKGELRRI